MILFAKLEVGMHRNHFRVLITTWPLFKSNTDILQYMSAKFE